MAKKNGWSALKGVGNENRPERVWNIVPVIYCSFIADGALCSIHCANFVSYIHCI